MNRARRTAWAWALLALAGLPPVAAAWGARHGGAAAMAPAAQVRPPASAPSGVALPVALSSAEPAFLGGLLTQSRVLYPLQVGGWMAVSEQRPLRQADGVTVRYLDNHKLRWIDVAFYPVPVSGGDAMAALAAAERERLALAARRAGDAAELAPLERIRLQSAAAGTEGVEAWQLGVRYPQRGLATSMLMFERDLYVVRAQAQAGEPAAPADSLQRELQAFMQGMAARLRIVSTGACWLPAHTEVVAALPPAGAGDVLSSYRDPRGAVAAVALRDRVLVAREQAARGGELSAALSAVLYPGCVAPEAIEPEVPPDLREIRIEYHAPGRAGPSGGPGIGRPRPPLVATG